MFYIISNLTNKIYSTVGYLSKGFYKFGDYVDWKIIFRSAKITLEPYVIIILIC
jgi:hypothetical protein